jgi:acylglycerol lipase
LNSFGGKLLESLPMTIENSRVAQDSPPKGGSPGWQDAVEIRSDDGVNLALRSATMAGAVLADVVLVHGLGEHSGRYEHVAAVLAGRGLRTCAWDLRGHGRSGGARGDAERHAMLVEDLALVVAHFTGRGRPWFLLAHSLGGQLALRYLEERQPDCAGAAILAPWLRLAFDPPWWRLVLARAALRVWPAFAQRTGNVWARLSRDTAHLATLPDLELVHHRLSARLYFGLRAAGEAALEDAARLRVPLLLMHGEDDPITCAAATRELYARAGSADKTLRTYPGVRHEIHNDLGREQVLAEVADWLVARVPTKGRNFPFPSRTPPV